MKQSRGIIGLAELCSRVLKLTGLNVDDVLNHHKQNESNQW
jgi:hypothetical protein